MRPSEQARAILDTINYATVATISDGKQPWNTPVAAFHFANDYTIYWASWKDNQHSKNIRSNGNVFLVIYDSTPADQQPSQGVYMQATAEELIDKNEIMNAALVFKDDPYNPSDGTQYMGDHPRRIYKAAPQHIWVNDDDTVDNNFVDIRITAEES
jgi:nitroimidazol reductase NimA-like FMN-containing flavoprotein (pyridoxamine 5'-phosphate oxidase superfamily)